MKLGSILETPSGEQGFLRIHYQSDCLVGILGKIKRDFRHG